MLRTVVCPTICVLFAFATAAQAQPSVERDMRTLDLRVLEQELCSSPTDVGRSNHRGRIAVQTLLLLEEFSNEELRELLVGENTSLALGAAWDFVRRGDETERPVRVDWFFGYLVGRTRTSPPTFWRRSVQTRWGRPYAQAEEEPRHAGPEEEPPCVKIANVEYTLQANQDVRIEEGRAVFRSGELACAVDPEAFLYMGKGRGAYLEYHLDSEFLAVVGHVGIANRVEVLCFSTIDGRLLWQGESWGNLVGANTDRHLLRNMIQHIELRRFDDTLVVFGSGSDGNSYFDALHLETGDCAYRFSTCCWYARAYRRMFSE